MKLNEADRRVVDLLLDQAQSTMVSQGGPGYAAADGQTRIRHVERLLGLLDAWEAPDPPKDLVSRTIRHIPRASRRVSAPPAAHPAIDAHFNTSITER